MTFVIARADGAKAEVRLDLWESHNAYAVLCGQFSPEGQPVELATAWVAWLAERGCPVLSHGNAFRLAAAVSGAVAEFKKKHAIGWGMQDSPASTGSTAQD